MDDPTTLEQRLAPYSGAVPEPRHRIDPTDIHENPADHPRWCAVRHDSGTRHVGKEDAWRPNGDQACRLSLRLVSSGVVASAATLVQVGVVDEHVDGPPQVVDVALTAADVGELVRRLEAAVQHCM
jgi:hypothetical protein